VDKLVDPDELAMLEVTAETRTEEEEEGTP
jgi:hypothetical protein